VLGRVSEGHGGKGLEDSCLGDLRWGTRASERHRGSVPEELEDPLLVPQALGNIRSKVPSEGAEEVLAHARAVRDAPTLEAGEAQAASLIESFGSVYPAAVKSFADDLEASLVHL
jgi:hypothetical protein